MARELHYTELENTFSIEDFAFAKNIESFSDLVGQERAKKSIEFGLGIKKQGYNIYASGQQGTGKMHFTKNFIESIAKTEKMPPDLCYVYNFKNPNEPKLLKIKDGRGNSFKNQMEDTINKIIQELSNLMSSKDFENKRNKILKKYQEIRDSLIDNVAEKARKKKFGIKTSQSGIYFMPIVDDEIITEEQFESLSEEQKNYFSKNSEIIQKQVSEVMRKIKKYETETKKELSNLEFSECLFVLGYQIGKTMEDFSDENEVINYLLDLKEDILNNIDEFTNENNEEEENLQLILPWYNKKNNNDFLNRYRINVVVDNSMIESAPIIIEHHPNYINLVGEIEYDSEFGNLSTDFMKIKAGSLYKANGGYLVLQAQELLNNQFSWDVLRRVLKTNSATIEPLREYITGLVVTFIKPEKLDLDIKVIIVGSQYYYELLDYYDENFRELFKIKADFDYEMNVNDNNISGLVKFIKGFVSKESLLTIDNTAIVEILKFSQKTVSSQKKLSTRFSNISELLTEAIEWANLKEETILTKESIKETIRQKKFRSTLYEEKLDELYNDNIIIIDTIGEKIGQINGLAVLDTGEYSFGKPSKITATTCLGKSGIINIEKEADMSGNIHDKGVQVLAGFFGYKYAQDFPLALSCRICFEQNYNGIDGDSASSTELYAILSSLSEVPITQQIAVTGSINQFGEIQPIGGVTEKIEGYFNLCDSRGLTGKQGVIIPEQNISDLTLEDKIIEAVKNNKFHIYPIKTIDEGIEILTGIPAGIKDNEDKYDEKSIHGKVYKKLEKYYKISIKS